MPYRLRYEINIDYTPAGIGLGEGAPSYAGTPGSAAGGGGATFYFPQAANPSSNTFTNTDVAAMLTAMVADLTAQLNAVPTQTKIQNAGTFSAMPPPSGA